MIQESYEEYKTLSLLARDTESLLEDLFLSGFRSARQSTTDQLQQLTGRYDRMGMEEGARLIRKLTEQVRKEQESFSGNPEQTMAAFARAEFYLEHLKSRVEGLA